MSSKFDQWKQLAKDAIADGIYSGEVLEPDYRDWAQLSHWPDKVAVALSHGLEPFEVNWPEVEKRVSDSKVAKRLWRTLEKVRVANAAGDLVLDIRPYLYVQWVATRKLEVPEGLVAAIADCGQSVADLSVRCCELEREVERLRAQIKAGKMSPKSELSLLRMARGMACDKYSYIAGARSSAPSLISGACARAGYPVTDETVRSQLSRADQLCSESAEA